MSTSARWSRQSPLQSILLAGLLLFFVSHFVLLSPSSLEDDFGGMRIIHPRDLLGLLQNETETLALSRLPSDTPPSYSLRDIRLVSAHERVPELRLEARKTASYQKERLTHFRDIVVETSDRVTITAREALHDQTKNEFRFLGSVKARFPGGTEVMTEEAELQTRPGTRIRVADTVRVEGRQVRGNQTLRFTSFGLDYTDRNPEHLKLLKEVRVRTGSTPGLSIRSDSAEYASHAGLLSFSMSERRPLEQQFVILDEADFHLRSRRLELDLSKVNELETVRAEGDVFFNDSSETGREISGTGGRALYRVEDSALHLSEFPQLYQDRDTITGEIIVYHRKSDTIEVRQSNASYGK